MADKEKKKGLGVVAKLVIVVVLAVAVVHLAARFGKVEALKAYDVVGMAIGYGE
jgi:hypothetical protein